MAPWPAIYILQVVLRFFTRPFLDLGAVRTTKWTAGFLQPIQTTQT